MAIQKNINKIRTAVLGKEVRSAIADSIEECYIDATTKNNANMEVSYARGEYNTLDDRLNAQDLTLEVEKARIDNFTKLQDGSTTGDAELIDARIMSNSEVASNLGDAIRTQTSFIEKMSNLKDEENGLIGTVLDVPWQLGKYDTNDGSAFDNASMARTWRFKVDGVVELNIKNPNDYTLYHYFLFDENDNFLSSGELASKFIIKHSGKIAFDTAKVNYPLMGDKIAETKNNFIITQYKSELESVKNDVAEVENKVIQLESESGLPFNDDCYQKIIVYNTKVIDNSISTTPATLDYYKYPLIPVWGHEYLEHWYERIYDGTNNVTIALDGDSITRGSEPLTSVQDAFVGMKDHSLKRIMKAGNYDLSKLNIKNNGYGGRNTNEWVGNSTYAMPTWLNQFPNGFLHQSMSYNPDLLIIGYGMNDADKTHSMFNDLTLEQRLKLFKTNMEEGLQRIRGNAPVNGRPAYNKPTKELSIIITLPTMGTIANTGRTNLEWFQNVRPIIQELCRKYECAFADFTMRTYAHNDMKVPVWATLNADGRYGTIHPNKYSMAQIMSQLQDLIYPVCMWNIDIN